MSSRVATVKTSVIASALLIAFVLIWWILMAMPPSLRQWRLTGNHRIVHVMMANVQSTQ